MITELIKKTKHFWAAMITLQALFFIIVFVGAKPDTSDIIAVEFGFIVMCAIFARQSKRRSENESL